jgi:hypothetical protein
MKAHFFNAIATAAAFALLAGSMASAQEDTVHVSQADAIRRRTSRKKE